MRTIKRKHKLIRRWQQDKLAADLYLVAELAVDIVRNGTVTSGFETISSRTGMHARTVQKLYYKETRYPRIQTVQQIAAAAGLNVQLSKRGIRVEPQEKYK